jgi:chitosanase
MDDEVRFLAIATVPKALILAVGLAIAAGVPVAGASNYLAAFDLHKKDIVLQLVSSAENGSTDWRAQYAYIEDIEDGRGYTAGIVGFCSGCGDMLKLIQNYTLAKPDNSLAKYIPALQQVYGTASHKGLDPTFVADWKAAAKDPVFQRAQDNARDAAYFNPAVSQAKADGLGPLGQFIYYDAMVMHGLGSDSGGFASIRTAAMHNAKTPAQDGNETAYLGAFLDARRAVMLADPAHADTSRIDTEQRVFLQEGNLNLSPPLAWQVYGNHYTIPK